MSANDPEGYARDAGFAVLDDLGLFLPSDESFLASLYAQSEPEEFLEGRTPANLLNQMFAPTCGKHIAHLAKRAERRGQRFSVFDVGGYLGHFGLAGAKALKEQKLPGEVTIFEPTPLHGLIERSVEINRLARTKVLRAGVSGEKGETKYYATPGRLISGRLYWFEGGQALYDVETVTLDDMWKAAGRPEVVLAKIDTEGHEVEVLKGAREMLAGAEVYLVLELWAPWRESELFGTTYEGWLRDNWHVIDIGNSLQLPKRDRVRPERMKAYLDELSRTQQTAPDVLCIPRRRRA